MPCSTDIFKYLRNILVELQFKISQIIGCEVMLSLKLLTIHDLVILAEKSAP